MRRVARLARVMNKQRRFIRKMSKVKTVENFNAVQREFGGKTLQPDGVNL